MRGASTQTDGGGALANSSNCANPGQRTAFYFVVFPSNNAAIFNSNRMLLKLFSDEASRGASAPSPALCASTTHVADYADLYSVQDEAPQATLQSVAFPSVFCRAFSCSASAGSCGDGESEAEEGPPWNMRVETVTCASHAPPAAAASPRFHRIILTASFTVIVSQRTDQLDGRQTRDCAVALVLHCPPHAGGGGDDAHSAHHTFLLSRLHVLRSLLHRVLDFGMSIATHFFRVMAALPNTGQQALRQASAAVERRREGRLTAAALKEELCEALQQMRAPVALGKLDDAGSHALYEAFALVDKRLGPTFFSVVAAGVLSLLPPPPTTPPQPETQRAEKGAEASSTGTAQDVDDAGSFTLQVRRRGRVVIFCQDAALARALMHTCAFLLSLGRDGGGAAPTAAEVRHCHYDNATVQWVAREYADTYLPELLSPYSTDNALLVVHPRGLRCQRYTLHKSLLRSTILLSIQAGAAAAAGTTDATSTATDSHSHSHFCCRVRERVTVAPHPVLRALLQEALLLHRATGGAVAAWRTVADAAVWLAHLSAAQLARTATAAEAENLLAEAASPQSAQPTHSRQSPAPTIPPADAAALRATHMSAEQPLLPGTIRVAAPGPRRGVGGAAGASQQQPPSPPPTPPLLRGGSAGVLLPPDTLAPDPGRPPQSHSAREESWVGSMWRRLGSATGLRASPPAGPPLRASVERGDQLHHFLSPSRGAF